jgi:4-hydroxy-tetrahydrodipicolinate synthase
MNKKIRLEGLGVALATPFLPAQGRGEGGFGSGAVDLPAFRNLVRYVAENGADFLVVLGSTGEGPTVLPGERDELIQATVEESRGLPVVVGTGHNSTKEAAALAARAAELGADALLVVTPYYNKPQARGLVEHYKAVAAAAGLPIVAYNVPGRTGLNLQPRDLELLWAIPELVALKESSGNLAQIGEIARRLPEGKALFSGDDALALPSIAQGASGLVSVVANLLPAETKKLVAAARRGDLAEARRFQRALLPLMDALFAEPNPVPLKAAMEIMGLSSGAVRLPLAPAEELTKSRIASCLEAIAKEKLCAPYSVGAAGDAHEA